VRVEPRRAEARLLPQLPPSRRARGLPRLDLAARKFPESAQQSRRRASLDEPATGMVEHDDGGVHVWDPSPSASSGEAARVREFPPRSAAEADGASLTRRRDRAADGLAQLHQRFVEPTRPLGREERLERRAQPRSHRARSEVALLAGPPGRDAEAVRLERELPCVEREARDRARDVRTDAR
jgi:hypothetical protein